MKINRKIITDYAVVAAGLVLGISLSACAGLNGANGDVCNSGNTNCVSFSVHPGSPSGSPVPASTYLTPTPQSESPSASIPGVTTSPTYSASPTLTPPPSITAAPPTSSPVPEPQFDSSLHRCKSGGGVDTLLSVQVDNQLFSCMALPPDQANLLIQLVVLAVYDALTHQPFNPPAQYAPQAQQAQDVVTAYQGQS